MSGAKHNIEDYRPNIVLFARHFPPHVSGGARRPYYLAKALQHLGCRVFVVAPALPDDMEGIAVPHVQPDPPVGPPRAPGLRDILRNWLLWPDPDIRWTKRAVQAAKQALPFKPDWVVTTSPPESIHYAGMNFKKTLGCYWCADLRDHWLVRPFRKQRRNVIRKWIERKIASNMLCQADLISTVNEDITREARQYCQNKARIFTLPHFSIEDAGEVVALNSDHLNLVYTGSFSLSDPDCHIGDTLAVFETARRKNPALHLHIAGRLSTEEEAQVRACTGAEAITLYGVVPLQRAHALQRAADALVLAGSPHALTPPGKAAEYEACAKPVIAITKAAWAGRYNGDKNAHECLVGLDKGAQREQGLQPETQAHAAQRVLRNMMAVHSTSL
jgi:glycosyltransferase involved in cell wall biosynthesis